MATPKNIRYISSLEPQEQDDLVSGSDQEETTLGIEDFAAILRRRKVALVLPMILLTAASIVIAWSLPELYRSTAKILVEQQEIPNSLVQSTVSTYAGERIQAITQRVLTTEKLEHIIDKLDLYTDERAKVPIEALVARVSRNFDVGLVRAKGATIAFNVSFVSKSPQLAQLVATEISSLYLEENLKIRTESAADTTGFLLAEAKILGGEVNDLEQEIAAFKQAHMGRLPEQLALNIDLMNRAEQRMRQIDQQIRSLEDRKVYLEIGMSQLSANPQGGPNPTLVQLQALRAELSGKLAAYTPEHPDVVQLRAEIEHLEKQLALTDPDGLQALQTKLRVLQAELAEALKRYSSDHPEVTSLERQVTELEITIGATRAAGKLSKATSSTNISVLEHQAQYRSAEVEIATLRSEYDELKAKVNVYEKRIEQMPEIEREYSLLVRDRDNLIAKYREITAKMSTARVAENLERANKGERFSLIEPARKPAIPFKPNRQKIVMLGIIGSVGAGIGTVVLREILQKAVYGARGVIALLGVPPLAVIPYIENVKDRRRRLRGRIYVVLLILSLVIGAAISVHFLVAPLDQLWVEFLKRLEPVRDILRQRMQILFN
jgi:uncharacterized protein involved in exopolysaccharide biosynthesis